MWRFRDSRSVFAASQQYLELCLKYQQTSQPSAKSIHLWLPSQQDRFTASNTVIKHLQHGNLLIWANVAPHVTRVNSKLLLNTNFMCHQYYKTDTWEVALKCLRMNSDPHKVVLNTLVFPSYCINHANQNKHWVSWMSFGIWLCVGNYLFSYQYDYVYYEDSCPNESFNWTLHGNS